VPFGKHTERVSVCCFAAILGGRRAS